MDVKKTLNDDLTAKIDMVITKDDYKDQYTTELKKIRKDVHLKGFRKGSVPLPTIKKMYGTKVAADIIDKKIAEGLHKFFQEDETKFILQPVAKNNLEIFDAKGNLNDQINLEFTAGYYDNLDIKGLDDVYELAKVQVTDEMVNDEFERLLKSYGKVENFTEGTVEENDLIRLNLIELNDSDAPKVDGRQVDDVVVLMNYINDDDKGLFLGKEVGETAIINPHTLEKNGDEKSVRRLLKIEDEEAQIGDRFEAKLVGYNRLIPAEPTKENLIKAFPDLDEETIDEQKVKEQLKKQLQDSFDQSARHIVEREVMKAINEKSTLDYSEDFVKQYFKENNGMTDEQVEQNFDEVKSYLKWNIIKEELFDKYDVKFDREKLEANIKQKVTQQYGSQYPGMDFTTMMPNILQQLSKDPEAMQKEVDEVKMIQVLEGILNDISTTEKNMTVEEFNELAKSHQDNDRQQ